MGDNTTDETKITHISDTALWVAVYRAMESKAIDELHFQGCQRGLSRPPR